MAKDHAKATLHRYLQAARDALLWKLDGLSEYPDASKLAPGDQSWWKHYRDRLEQVARAAAGTL